MKDGVLKKTLERHESLQRLLEPLSVQIEALQPDLSIQRLLANQQFPLGGRAVAYAGVTEHEAGCVS